MTIRFSSVIKVGSILLALTLILDITGCNAYPSAITPMVATSTSPPAETATSVSSVTQSLETMTPTLNYPPTQTSIPESWLVYTNSSLHLKFQYPANWQPETPTRFSGPDGYFELSTQSYPASEFDSLTTLCVLESNQNKPAAYGAYPFVTIWQGLSSQSDSAVGFGCTVTPSDDQPASPHDRAVLFARYPQPWPRNTLLVLQTDSVHFNGILSTLQFTDYVTPTPHPINTYNSPACAVLPAEPEARISHFAGLTITEYPIVGADCDPWAHIDGFQVRVRTLNLDNGANSDADRLHRAETANRLLQAFAYRLVGRQFHPSNPPGSTAPGEITVFDLYHGNKLLTTGITRIGQISVNASGDEFILWVQDSFNNKPAIEVRRDSLRTLAGWESGFNTAWAGSDLVGYAYASDHLFPVGAASQAIVYRNGKAIYNLTIPQPGPAGDPVQWLWTWQDHWFLEVGNVVVQDGVLQNPKLGFSEMFAWHLVNDQPFYFFSKAGTYEISYAGQTLPQRYEDIIHGQICCGPAAYSLDSSSEGAWFYALRNKIWYLVSALAE